MTFLAQIREREQETTAGGMLAVLLRAIGLQRAAARTERTGQGAADPATATSMGDVRRQVDAWKRGDDELLD